MEVVGVQGVEICLNFHSPYGAEMVEEAEIIPAIIIIIVIIKKSFLSRKLNKSRANLQLPKVRHLIQKFTHPFFFCWYLLPLSKIRSLDFVHQNVLYPWTRARLGFVFFQNVFRLRVVLLSETHLIQFAIGHIQIYFNLYLFAKFTCCQEKLLHVFARCFFHELLLKVSVCGKVYTA